MILKRRFLLFLLLIYPTFSFGLDVDGMVQEIERQTTFAEAADTYEDRVMAVINNEKYSSVSDEFAASQKSEMENNIRSSANGIAANDGAADAGTDAGNDASNADGDKSKDKSKKDKKDKKSNDTRTEEEKKKALEEKGKAYKDAKENEQSLANRTLTAATTAATGIGGMQLAMGLSEQKADKAAEQDMDAYLRTFRCTYGDGKSVKGGLDEIELPGANIPELMKLRTEYVSLAKDLKERKESLGMKPGIESEGVLDKSEMGLYDDEFVGITGGAYGSLYRAKALGSEEDQAKLDADKKEAKNRVIAGGVLVGTGVVGGALGNSLINGKLGELIKQKKADKNASAETKKALKIEEEALKDIQKCLKSAGVKDSDKLSFEKFGASALSMKNIDCKKDLEKVKDKFASELFEDTDDASVAFDKLVESFGGVVAGKMVGLTVSETPTDDEKTKAKDKLKKSLEEITKRFADAAKEDEKKSASESSSDSSSDGNMLSGLKDKAGDLLNNSGGEDGGLSGIASKASGLLGGGGEGGGATSALGGLFGG